MNPNLTPADLSTFSGPWKNRQPDMPGWPEWRCAIAFSEVGPSPLFTSFRTMHLHDVFTPALVLDKGICERNISRMHAHLAGFGVPLRPHVKTCKSLPLVNAMLAGQSGGITVSTLREASFFLQQGIRDITYAVSIAPGKLDTAASIMKAGADLKLLLETADVAKTVARHGVDHGVTYKVLIEIDSDGHRAGLKPGDARVVEIGEFLHHSPGVRLEGVLTHAGSSYRCRSVDDITTVAGQERAAIVQAADALRAAGLPCAVVSAGSTPTATLTKSLKGVTEVRAGVFVFQDLFQVSLGVCSYEDMACAVLAEVIGVDRDNNRVFIDAGALALSKDRSTAASSEDLGFGLVSRPGEPVSGGDYVVSEVFQEHGVLVPRSSVTNGTEYQTGDRVLVWPNHACMTAAAYDYYTVVDGGTEVVEIWSRINGWDPAIETHPL